MFERSQKAALPVTQPELLCFEQPLTERMRTFLRLEFLYEQARFHMDGPADFSARATIASILEILAILGRGDARAEVLKDLERQSERLAQFRRTPGVDTERLGKLLAGVERRKADLTNVGSQFLQPIRDCAFLSAIKHRSAIPGGTCSFDLPDYGYWLSLPLRERIGQLDAWLDLLAPLCDAVGDLLWFARESGEPQQCVAEAGFYQTNLDRSAPASLIRLSLDSAAGVYPEVSAGKHRLTVRFVKWIGIDQRPTQMSDRIDFELTMS
ncbi:MAG TPA: cell division protein ZapD [Gammaproteobacteria bacterium]|nr:cell division protein ZapD [Gammaproteobacteria bacterium]